MQSRAAALERVLLAIFALVVASFVAATAYSQYRAEAIDERARQIAVQVSPAIDGLAAIRTGVRRLQEAASRYANASPTDQLPAFDDLNRQQQAMHDDIERYLLLPLSAEDRERWRAEVDPRMIRLSDQLRRVIDEVRARNQGAARGNALQDLAEAADSLNYTIQQNLADTATLARELAVRIEQTRERAAIIGWTLDLLCTVTAAIGAVLVIRQHRRQAALAEAHSKLLEQRNQDLEEFSGRVAHDILSPLTAIGMTFGVLDHKKAERPDLAPLVARGMRSLHKVELIVAGLLEFARAGAHSDADARTDVQRVIDDLVATCGPSAERAMAKLECEPFRSCAVACNPGVLTSLVSNLVENAIKYMGDSPVRHITVRVKDRGALVRVEVQDTGPGIPSELALRVFSPYVRGTGSGRPGIGLGLATVKRMAEAHGGSVGVQTALGCGSVFWFELPQAASAAVVAARVASEEPAPTVEPS
jgi:signal transduction histidine kinase